MVSLAECGRLRSSAALDEMPVLLRRAARMITYSVSEVRCVTPHSRSAGGCAAQQLPAAAPEPGEVSAFAAASPSAAAAPRVASSPNAASPSDVVLAVRGSGSTAVQSLLTAVLGNFSKEQPGASITYDAVGSGQGARDTCQPSRAFKRPASLSPTSTDHARPSSFYLLSADC